MEEEKKKHKKIVSSAALRRWDEFLPETENKLSSEQGQQVYASILGGETHTHTSTVQPHL